MLLFLVAIVFSFDFVSVFFFHFFQDSEHFTFNLKHKQPILIDRFFNVHLLRNPLHPSISIHILPTVRHTFPMVLTMRICLTIKSFLSW